MTTVIRPGDMPVVSEPSNAVLLRELVTAASTGGDISVTWVQLADRHRRLMTARSTRVYLVLAGAVTMQVGTAAPALVEAGQLVVIPRETPYELTGVGSYLVVNSPGFVPGDDQYLEPES